jgi:hypothetical protein
MSDKPNVAEISARLSGPQWDFLCSLPSYAVATYPPAKWLCFKGLAEWSGHRFVATDLGEQVIRHRQLSNA